MAHADTDMRLGKHTPLATHVSRKRLMRPKHLSTAVGLQQKHIV